MALLKPAWMQAVTGDPSIAYSAQQDRAAVLSALFSREGVIDPDAGQLKVTQRSAGANYSVDIAPGRAGIFGDDVSDQGTYIVTSTAVENRTVPNPPASGTRTHRVIARVRDKLHNGVWTGYDWTIEVLADTGSGTPAVPASAISLATVTVAAGQASVTNANITDTRPFASVGTKARVGSWDMPSGFWNYDNNRRGRYQITPDGFVSLSGWYSPKQNITYGANVQAKEVQLPAAMRPAATRDFIGLSSLGPVHWAVTSDGWLYQRYNVTTEHNTGTWISFDGCGYLL